MSAPTAEEVAADFKDCLSDLQMNNRYEISNLTIIAKENIDFAQALSKALENHIRTVRFGDDTLMPIHSCCDSVFEDA